MKQKKWQKNLLFTLGLFTLLTAAAALLDDGWWAKTTESAGSMTGWALGGLFRRGAASLSYKGCCGAVSHTDRPLFSNEGRTNPAVGSVPGRRGVFCSRRA